MRLQRILFVFTVLVITQSLSVHGQWLPQNATTGSIYYNGGNVGIGTTIPQATLSLGEGSGKRMLVYDGSNGVQTGFGVDMSGSSRELSVFLSTSDGSNGNISFGKRLESSGAYSELMRIQGNGNVGIGTNNPSAKLEIPNNGNASLRVGISSNMANTHTQLINSLAVIGDNSSTITSNAAVAWDYYNNGNNPSWSGTVIQHVGTAISGTMYGAPASNLGTLLFQNVSNGVIASNGSNIFISPSGTLSASFLTNGNVGIGTTDTKGYKFAVNGSAVFTKVVVKQSQNWPDYVFRTSYQLRPLSEVEEYIQQNHHLPEVPSAEEVKKDGLNLGDNQAALLKKIEELTLYVIEQNKNQVQQQRLIEEQQRLIQQQQQRLEALEKSIKK